MFDPDTFLTALYVAVDDGLAPLCCKEHDTRHTPGPLPSLCPSEVVTLALFAQWGQFRSERSFYRYARQNLRAAFPTLPHRAQFNRLARAHEPLVRQLFATMAAELVTPTGGGGHGGGEPRHRAAPYELIDTTAVPTRNVRRHGLGWLPGQAAVGWSTRLGWYEGAALLAVVTPEGVITGFGLAPASVRESLLADTFLSARHDPAAAAAAAAGTALALGPTRPAYYIADGAFESRERQERWAEDYGTHVIAPPRRSAKASWPEPLRRWVATLRQRIEGVNEKLHDVFRLSVERPHLLSGLLTRVAAMVTLHNFCIWLNRQVGRQDLAFVDLVDW